MRTPELRTVLVVDDDEDLRAVIRQVLTATDRFDVVGEAATGAAAVEAARRLQPDLVIMDVRLPNGDGEEATRLLGSVSPRTKVLAHSASDDRSAVLDMVAAGADGYLVKSGDVRELLEALETVAAGGVHLDGALRNLLVDQVRSSRRDERSRMLPVDRDHRTVDQALQPGNLQIAFQPVVDLRSDGVVGHEALSRFRHVDGPAGVFAAAARVGRRVELEVLAVRRAVEAAAGLDLDGRFLSVNISPDVAVATEVALLLDGPHIAPSDVVIEITEQTGVEDYASLTAALDGLRRRGVRLAVDDVGSGFACLTHVHRLLPDLLKIDRYLVAGIQRDPTRRSMVSALVRIAEDTGAVVIAEGIEEAAERSCLLDLGIHLGQGFLLGRPAMALVGGGSTRRPH